MLIVVDKNGLIVGMLTEEEATVEAVAACANNSKE